MDNRIKDLKDKIFSIVDDKLSDAQMEELTDFLRQAISNNLAHEYDGNFFKNFAYEMTGGLKEMALLMIEFKRDLKSKINPEITNLATVQIPQATDQLEGVIETTEMAAHKIMDNLEIMQEQTEEMERALLSLQNGGIKLPKTEKEPIDSRTIKKIYPLIDYLKPGIQSHKALVSDCFVQMSFQDLTGQRIRRIMTLVNQMEEKLKDMIVSFGFKLTEIEKKPHISKKDLQRAVEEKATALAGPQRKGRGLDQEGIDELLANM